MPANVPPFAALTVSLGENADKATTSTTSLAVRPGLDPVKVIVEPFVAVKSDPSTSFTPLR